MDSTILRQNRMYCEKYGCHMSMQACIARQKVSMRPGPKWRGRGRVPRDPGCVNCKQGEEIMQQATMPRADQTAAIEPKTGPKQPAGKPAPKLKCCTRCGAEKPASVEYFNRDRRSRDNLTSWCKKCQAEHKRLALEKKKTAAKGKRRAAPAPAGKPAKSDMPLRPGRIAGIRAAGHLLTIDFSDYPEILERLKQAARAEMRPPEMQALACIAAYCETDGMEAVDRGQNGI